LLCGCETPQLYSNLMSVEPVIDGIFTETEWEDAKLSVITLYSASGDLYPVKLYLKNSEHYLYLSLLIPDDQENLIILRFKDNHGRWDAKHDRYDQGPWDNYWNGSNWGPDPIVNVESSWGLLPDQRIIECKIPLNSGDIHDIMVDPGETIKFGIRYGLEKTAKYPLGNHYTEPETWADLKLKNINPSVSVGGKMITNFSLQEKTITILFISTLLVSYILSSVTKKYEQKLKVRYKDDIPFTFNKFSDSMDAVTTRNVTTQET